MMSYDEDVLRLIATHDAERERMKGLVELGEAWTEAEAALPEGWLFYGVSLADHSAYEAYVDAATRSTRGPDWSAAATWLAHCEYDDCDHDEANLEGNGPTPAAALRALAAKLRARYDFEQGRAAERERIAPLVDEAWTEAEAALPEGWHIRLQSGLFATEPGDCVAEAWAPMADDARQAFGPTPAAALRALAAKLRAAHDD